MKRWLKVFQMLLILFPSILYAQENYNGLPGKYNNEYLNWYNQCPMNDKIQGVSTNRAYAELLKGITPGKRIIVAIIDGGVDIEHPDLKDKIWINKKEIPGNGIDDDNNNYIDDVHGWNFIGNSKGENLQYENLEFVRIYKELSPKYAGISDIREVADEEHKTYELFVRCKERYAEQLELYTSMRTSINKFEERMEIPHSIIKEYLKRDDFEIEDILAIQTESEMVNQAVSFYGELSKNGFSIDGFKAFKNNTNKYLDYYLNLDFEPRKMVADNPYDITDIGYGNNDVKGPQSSHGTFVAGVVAATRNNGIGTDGIASNVEIMVLRVVPEGDERDKDIALAIRYAVDNGADIINMSFGKYYSLHRSFVDDAIEYADKHNVLMIKSAGNESDNLDEIDCYPTPILNNGKVAINWITVGASSNKRGKELCGTFSNYGKERVDIFAPGVDIISLYADNSYNMANGTSFSCPVVSGVAALVWSYYPELTALELKNILLETSIKYPKQRVYVPGKDKKRIKARFSDLSSTGGIVNAYNAILHIQKRKAVLSL